MSDHPKHSYRCMWLTWQRHPEQFDREPACDCDAATTICKDCIEPIYGWHTLLTVTDGPDAGRYHKGCFDDLVRKRQRGQWNIVYDDRPRHGRQAQ